LSLASFTSTLPRYAEALVSADEEGYGTEAETRQSVERSNVSRDKVFITSKSKLWPNMLLTAVSPFVDGKPEFTPGYDKTRGEASAWSTYVVADICRCQDERGGYQALGTDYCRETRRATRLAPHSHALRA
jgi:hypothetical protein